MKIPNTSSPLISVIIPAYNAELFIEQTIKSALSQTYSNIEVIVVDDGSEDRTAEITNLIALKDHRVILIQQPNKGVAAARNLAIQQSSGEFIAPLDADDVWLLHKLEKQLEFLIDSGPSVGLVYAWSTVIDEKGKLLGKHLINREEGNIFPELLLKDFIGNASVPLIRRSCFEKVGLYNCLFKEHNVQGIEDWDLSLRIAEQYEFRLVPQVLVLYRRVMGSMSCDSHGMAKCYHLMISKIQQQHSEISISVYRQAACRYYLFLVVKSIRCGDYLDSLFWMSQVLKVDFRLLLRPWVYQLIAQRILESNINLSITNFSDFSGLNNIKF